MKKIFVVLVVLIAVSCVHQRALQKAYVGKPVASLSGKFGYPKVVLDQKNEKIYVYEIVKDLKSATINQGKLTLDPMISPSVQKKERYYFTVVNEKITKVKLEEEYSR